MGRQSSREEAFKILFQLDFHEQFSFNQPNNNFTSRLVTGISEHKIEIDKLISNHLENWTIDRIAIVEKTILRIATYEIFYLDDIPFAVSINEAVELCHKYGDEKSGKFVNGVLSKMV